MRSNWHSVGKAGAAKHYTGMQMHKVLKPSTNRTGTNESNMLGNSAQNASESKCTIMAAFTYLYLFL